MFCVQCGKQIENDMDFCPFCGSAQGSVTQQTEEKLEEKLEEKPEREPKEKKPKKKGKGGVIALIIILILLLAAGAVLFYLLRKKDKVIHLNDYLVVEIEGYDTAGIALVGFDYEKFEEDYGDDAELLETVIAYADESYGLSNGDRITISIECDEDFILEEYGYEVTYEEQTKKVSGLKTVNTFDPFEGLKVKFVGSSSNGRAKITAEAYAEEAEYLDYKFDKKTKLENGDVVTLTVYYEGEEVGEDFVEEFGAIPYPTSKTFVVSGLDEEDSDVDDPTEIEDGEILEEGIVFPESSTRILTESEIDLLTDEEIQCAINELYARNGYTFKDETKREFYEQYSWYEPTVSPDDFSMSLFSSIEKENVEMLQKERDSRK